MQVATLKQQQPVLLVATPGRLLDLIDDEECPLSLGKLPDAICAGHHARFLGQSEAYCSMLHETCLITLDD